MTALLLTALITLDGVPRPCVRPAPGARVQVDLVDAPVAGVARIVACYRGLNLSVTTPPKGTVTVFGPTAVSPAEVVLVLESALDDQGWILARRGQYLTLVPTKAAPSQPGRIHTGAPKRGVGRITMVVRPEHVDVVEVQPTLASLASGDASLIAHAPTNLLIITERADNVRRLERMLRQLDVPRGRAHLVFHSVNYADAQEVAAHVRTLFDDRVERITVDERTGRLIVLASRDVQLEVIGLLRQLDLPGVHGRAHTHAVTHAKAADLARIVESLRQTGRRSAAPRVPASQPARR